MLIDDERRGAAARAGRDHRGSLSVEMAVAARVVGRAADVGERVELGSRPCTGVVVRGREEDDVTGDRRGAGRPLASDEDARAG